VYFNVNFNVFFNLIKVHLLVSELYIVWYYLWLNFPLLIRRHTPPFIRNSVVPMWKVSEGWPFLNLLMYTDAFEFLDGLCFEGVNAFKSSTYPWDIFLYVTSQVNYGLPWSSTVLRHWHFIGKLYPKCERYKTKEIRINCTNFRLSFNLSN
jgi:hypothetical protein